MLTACSQAGKLSIDSDYAKLHTKVMHILGCAVKNNIEKQSNESTIRHCLLLLLNLWKLSPSLLKNFETCNDFGHYKTGHDVIYHGLFKGTDSIKQNFMEFLRAEASLL